MKWLMMTLLLAGPAAGDTPNGSFPPGGGVALTQKICTRCHGANLILSKIFDAASAERYWRTMVGTDPNSDEARKVITYLSTVLGEDNGGPDAALR
jgi:hypothetical protein